MVKQEKRCPNVASIHGMNDFDFKMISFGEMLFHHNIPMNALAVENAFPALAKSPDPDERGFGTE